MKIDKLLKIKCEELDKVKMILSNSIDYGCEHGGMISVKKFDELAKDIIKWKNTYITQQTPSDIKTSDSV